MFGFHRSHHRHGHGSHGHGHGSPEHGRRHGMRHGMHRGMRHGADREMRGSPEDAATTQQGECPLCEKHCPLSTPQCGRGKQFQTRQNDE